MNWRNLFTARKYKLRKCTCGERQVCTLQYYTTSRGGMGIDGGFEGCGKFIRDAEEASRILTKTKKQDNT